jgi:hypothetical protein
MSLNVDELLAELGDLPHRNARGTGPAGPSARGAEEHHGRAALPHSSHHRGISLPPGPHSTLIQGGATTSTGAAPAPGPHHARAKSVSGNSTSRRADAELEAMLQDLDFGGTPFNSVSGRSNARAVAAADAAVTAATKLSGASRTSLGGTKQKCTGIFVGGASFERGRMGAVGTLTCCDALRCTKCDFRVEQFR